LPREAEHPHRARSPTGNVFTLSPIVLLGYGLPALLLHRALHLKFASIEDLGFYLL